MTTKRALRFLIADDHPTMRQTIVQILRDEWPDALCTEVPDGAALLTRATHARFDLVISDVSMPHLSGLEALKALKTLEPHLPVLLVSINDHERYALRALRNGAAGFLPKWLLDQALVKAVRTALDGKRYISVELATKLATASL
ncbi:MAG TPA: response regulator transcription factor [Puia sp.]|uniref:response regulator n=1 Tax=Puia sp. TaxID=2045100 RepID=UPI002BC6E1AB|nr:response regulator transcription factor [Puia sp.]HVU94407.1 response regulator transcription factor [Puia sp.]